jgi:histidine triad (HIT) family protein
MSAVGECVLCGIVTGEVPSEVIHQDAVTLSFLTVEPATEGHALVIPKRHSRNLFDVEPRELASVASEVRQIAVWRRERLGCAGVSVFQANESAGFQTVFHFHVHVVSPYPGVRVPNAWRDLERADQKQLARVGRRLRGD